MAYSLKEQEKGLGEFELGESYFGVHRVRGKRGRGAGGKTSVFGLYEKEFARGKSHLMVSSASGVMPKDASQNSTV